MASDALCYRPVLPGFDDEAALLDGRREVEDSPLIAAYVSTDRAAACARKVEFWPSLPDDHAAQPHAVSCTDTVTLERLLLAGVQKSDP